MFEKIRDNSLRNYGLCPSHYFRAPAISWDAMFNMIKVELALITDPDKYVFFEKGMRGGVSFISIDVGKPTISIWNSKGCVLEVDLEYPKKLRELHKDYPIAPDKIEINREILSDYQLKFADLYNIPIGNVKKLVPNFFDKEKYVIHYENLKLYWRLGLKQKKIHRVLKFNQSQWLKQSV